ncbi:MAG: hypothetical protein ABI718_17740 [Acidobacteriota bacterium]
MGRPQTSFTKRQREQAKRERQKAKAERRTDRKTNPLGEPDLSLEPVVTETEIDDSILAEISPVAGE